MKEWFEGETVALVGNAMSLFDGDYGESIDCHEVVVRLNKAAMMLNNLDAEKTHGTKTDVWMFWSVNEYKKDFGNFPDVKKIHAGHQFRTNKDIELVDFVYPMELYEPLKEVAGERKNPTTGFIAIDYILHCEPKTLDIYGFDWKKTPTHTDPNRMKEKKCPHNHDTEEEYCREHVLSRPNVFLNRQINK